MLSRVGRRVSYANVMVTVAVVFAMAGGAYAAGKVVITSTKQIKPSVLKQLKGNAGAKGAAGTAGPAGPAGPGGPAGPAGPAGPKGDAGTAGTEGKEGLEGKEGKSGWAETLPSGKTIRGQFATSLAASTEFQTAQTGVSFPFLVKNEAGEGPVVHLVKNGETDPTGCTGSFESPAAEPGNLCVFVNGDVNALNGGAIVDFTTKQLLVNNGKHTSPMGFGILAVAEKAETVSINGSWAVTAE